MVFLTAYANVGLQTELCACLCRAFAAELVSFPLFQPLWWTRPDRFIGFNPSLCLQLFSSEENRHKAVEEDTISNPPSQSVSARNYAFNDQQLQSNFYFLSRNKKKSEDSTCKSGKKRYFSSFLQVMHKSAVTEDKSS